MSNFHQRMLKTAELDCNAALTLSKSKLFAHSIYFYAQTFEKVNKSIISLYMSSYENVSDDVIEKKLKQTYGHKLVKSTIDVLKSLSEYEKRLYISRGGKESDEFIQTSISSIEELEKHKFPIDDLIVNFFLRVEFHYEILYKSLYVSDWRLLDLRMQPPALNEVIANLERPEWQRLRSTLSDSSKRYLKILPIAWILSPLLEQMDIYTRYPTTQIANDNILSLMEDRNLQSCDMLHDMLQDYMSAIPQAWEKIQDLKKDFQKKS